jgi:hypothetical protein
MKKFVVFISAMFMFLTNSHAQNVAPYWSITGNTNALTTSKLGTVNAIPLRIMTKNIEWIRVDTFGRVGIGTTTPYQKLYVVGNASITGNLGLGITGPTQKLHVVGNGVVTGRVGVGTITPEFPLDVRSVNCFGQFKSIGGYAGVVLDKSATGLNEYVVHRTAGIDKWTEGMMGNDNFTLRNWNLGSNAFTVDITNNNIGIGSVVSNAKLYVVGTPDAYAFVASAVNGHYAGVFYGNVYSSIGFVTSDRNLKKDVQDFSDAMSIVNKLKPTNYLFKDDARYTSLNLPKGRHYGLLAQDLEQVLPNLVSENSHELTTVLNPSSIVNRGVDEATQQKAAEVPEEKQTKERITIKAVNYVELIPIVVKAMQEQDVKIKTQDAEIAKLKSEINEIAELKSEINELKALIKNANGSTGTTSGGYLKQNNPNPSNGNAAIKYFAPGDALTAQIVLTDIKGSVLKTYRVSTGEGQVTITKGELASGTYNYTLYINNRKIDTKQMVVAR